MKPPLDRSGGGRKGVVCRESGQQIPESPAEILRTLVDSLAMKCAYVLERLEEVIGHRVEVLHV